MIASFFITLFVYAILQKTVQENKFIKIAIILVVLNSLMIAIHIKTIGGIPIDTTIISYLALFVFGKLQIYSKNKYLPIMLSLIIVVIAFIALFATFPNGTMVYSYVLFNLGEAGFITCIVLLIVDKVYEHIISEINYKKSKV